MRSDISSRRSVPLIRPTVQSMRNPSPRSATESAHDQSSDDGASNEVLFRA